MSEKSSYSGECSNSNQLPSFFKNSCTGTNSVNEDTDQSIISVVESEGNISRKNWSKSLQHFPGFSESNIEEALIKQPGCFSKRHNAPKAYKSKKLGYRLWKEGFVRSIYVKPNVQGSVNMFLVKCRVHASMKNVSYNVYVRLNQGSGDLIYSKCSCKAGQGGCCKHVAALLFSLVDYSNLGYTVVPDTLTCTQVSQKWHVPTSTTMTLSKAVKFDDVVFRKDEPNKYRKRPFLNDARRNYCAVPPFAQQMTSETLEQLTKDLSNAGRAPNFCKAVQSNLCQPTQFFKTSSATRQCEASHKTVSKAFTTGLICSIFDNIKSENVLMGGNILLEDYTANDVQLLVGLSMEQAIQICVDTQKQGEVPAWYEERQKRITASHFGKIINRRKSIEPKTIKNQILTSNKVLSENMPAPLKWGIENEANAIKKYTAKYSVLENLEVEQCGLVINPAIPWLGCSPDGILAKENVPVGCIEVKCPYSKRGIAIAKAVKDKSFFLQPSGEAIQLKRRHAYYFQCQGLVNILNLPWIDFIVYTEEDLHVERIYRDVNLWKTVMLPELTSFYFSYILPEICEKQINGS